METKVSIITVCYNSALTIRRTIESVLAQTYKNIEYIVVDGASTDGTVEIIKEYENKFNGRMKWISEKDAGIYDAMNKGIKISTGTIVGIINSDDYYEPTAVQTIIENMDDSIYQVVYGAVRCVRDDKTYVISLDSHEFLEERMIQHPGCFVTKSTYEKFGVFDTKYKIVADHDLLLRFKEAGEVNFIPVFAIIANFTLGGTSSHANSYSEIIQMQYQHGLLSKKGYKTRAMMWSIRNFFVKIKLWNLVYGK